MSNLKNLLAIESDAKSGEMAVRAALALPAILIVTWT